MTDLVRPTHLLDQLARDGILRKTGLYLNEPDISYERLEAVGAFLASVRKTVQFAIGDLLVQVEVRYPEKFSQFAEVLEMSEGGLLEYVRVAEKVPRSIRRENLSWSHHRAVAALEVPEQKEWLERAEKEDLSHHQLRAELKTEAEPQPDLCPRCGKPW